MPPEEEDELPPLPGPASPGTAPLEAAPAPLEAAGGRPAVAFGAPPGAAEFGAAPGAEATWPPWGIAGSLLVVAAFSLTQLLLSLILFWLLRWLLPEWAVYGAAESPILMVAVPVSLFSSHVVGWLAIYLLLVRRHRQGLAAGLRLGRHPWGVVLRAWFSGMGLQVLAMVLVIFFPPPLDFTSPMERFLRFGPWAVALLFVMAVLMAPALEEAMFRGLLLPALRRRHGFPLSALVVTGLFTALHGTQTGGYLPPLLGIAFCGWFLARWRERSGSLWPPLAFHAGFNLTAFLPILFVSGGN